jgi:hypothetical protein
MKDQHLDVFIVEKKSQGYKLVIEKFRVHIKRNNANKQNAKAKYISKYKKDISTLEINDKIQEGELDFLKKFLPALVDFRINHIDEKVIECITDEENKFPELEKCTLHTSFQLDDHFQNILNMSNLDHIKTMRIEYENIKYLPVMQNVTKLSCRNGYYFHPETRSFYEKPMNEINMIKFPKITNLKINYVLSQCDILRGLPSSLIKLKVMVDKDDQKIELIKTLSPNSNLKKFSCDERLNNDTLNTIYMNFPNLVQLCVILSYQSMSPDILLCGLNRFVGLEKLKLRDIPNPAFLAAITDIKPKIIYLKLDFDFIVNDEQLISLSKIKTIQKLRLSQISTGSFLGTGELWPRLTSVGCSICTLDDRRGYNKDYDLREQAIENIERSLRYMSYYRDDVIYHYSKKILKWFYD